MPLESNCFWAVYKSNNSKVSPPGDRTFANYSIQVIVNDLPNVDAGIDVSICSGDSLTLNGNGALNYSWDNNVTDGVLFSPLQSGTFHVTGTDANGCENTDQLEITVFQLPNVNLSSLTPICNVNSAPVQLTGGTPQGGQYVGFAVSNNRFDPAISGSGFFQVDYSYLDSNIINLLFEVN